VGLNTLKTLNLTNGYPNKNKNNKVKSKPLELRSRVKRLLKRLLQEKKSDGRGSIDLNCFCYTD
jgi:hypothetical protein